MTVNGQFRGGDSGGRSENVAGLVIGWSQSGKLKITHSARAAMATAAPYKNVIRRGGENIGRQWLNYSDRGAGSLNKKNRIQE